MAKQTKPSKETTAQENLLGENTVLTISVAKTAVDQEYAKTLQKEASKVTLKGFRKGKAPLTLAESYIGQEKLMDHALNHLLPHAYEEEVKKAGIIPLTRPEFSAKEVGKGDTWIFEAAVAVAPEVKLGDYKKLIKAGHAKYQEKLAATKDAKENDDEMLQSIFVSLIEGIKPKIAPLLLQEEMNQQLNQLFSQLSQRNIELPDYIKSQGKTEEQFRQDLAALSLGALQLEFVLQEITKDLGLTVEDSDVTAWLKSQGYPEDTKLPEELRMRLDATLIRRKTTDEVLTIARA